MFGLTKQPMTRKRESGDIQVAGRKISLTVVEHSRAKRLTLRVEPGGREVRVTVPPKVGRDEIDRFVDRHQGWLAERISVLPDQPVMEPGMKVPIRGVPHRIVLVAKKRGITRQDHDGAGPVLLVYGDGQYIGRRIADFLKKQAKTDIEPLAAKHAKAIGKRIRSIRFKDTKSRWGSCSADGNLSFSWRIMMAPTAVIDYLVAHEVAHLNEMNHSERFWKLCEELCPNTKDCKGWLKRNGTKLQAIPL